MNASGAPGALRLAAMTHSHECLLPMLRDAEEGDDRIRATLEDPSCTTYAAHVGDELVGAAVVRWETGQPSELIYLAVTPPTPRSTTWRSTKSVAFGSTRFGPTTSITCNHQSRSWASPCGT
jgi:hypothetical protein